MGKWDGVVEERGKLKNFFFFFSLKAYCYSSFAFALYCFNGFIKIMGVGYKPKETLLLCNVLMSAV